MVAELRERISTLWDRLEESPEIRSAFIVAYPGNSVETLRALRKEVMRCEEKKRANIKLFVDKMRQELVEWWNKCCYTPQQRAKFMNFESDCYTEELLTLHEMEVEKLKSHYDKNKRIYNLFEKRERLWKKMLDLEQRANQPDRYQNRGGQLLNEEKEQKTIAAQLPKIEAELLSLVQQYEESKRIAFLISGERVEDIVKKAWEQHKENKRITLSTKKKLREQATPKSQSKSHIFGSSSRLTPRLTSRLTPTVSISKRKLDTLTPMLGSSKRSRIDCSTAKQLFNGNKSTNKRLVPVRRIPWC